MPSRAVKRGKRGMAICWARAGHEAWSFRWWREAAAVVVGRDAEARTNVRRSVSAVPKPTRAAIAATGVVARLELAAGGLDAAAAT